MPVYNGEKFLNEAIGSILNQTYSYFEFIIINDGSTDRTEDIILSYEDSRIRYVKNETNLQIVKALNKGISLAKGKYIARMDADDVSMPRRLEVQLEYMQAHTEITVCGSYLQVYGQPKHIWKPPLNNEAIKARLLFDCCLYHPTVIFKRDVLIANQGYSISFAGAEDYELWGRLSGISSVYFANIPEVLLHYRSDPNDMRLEYVSKQRKLSNFIQNSLLKKLDINPTEQDLVLHEHAVYRELYLARDSDFKNYQGWLDRIFSANNKCNTYSSIYLKKELEYRWMSLCWESAIVTPVSVINFIASHWSPNNMYSIYHAARMIWRSCKNKLKNINIL